MRRRSGAQVHDWRHVQIRARYVDLGGAVVVPQMRPLHGPISPKKLLEGCDPINNSALNLGWLQHGFNTDSHRYVGRPRRIGNGVAGEGVAAMTDLRAMLGCFGALWLHSLDRVPSPRVAYQTGGYPLGIPRPPPWGSPWGGLVRLPSWRSCPVARFGHLWAMTGCQYGPVAGLGSPSCAP